MIYKIVIDKPALKFLQKQPQSIRDRLLKAISLLPSQGDIKPMSGYTGLYRLRVSSYRVLYSVENDILIIKVLDIGNRGDVYK